MISPILEKAFLSVRIDSAGGFSRLLRRRVLCDPSAAPRSPALELTYRAIWNLGCASRAEDVLIWAGGEQKKGYEGDEKNRYLLTPAVGDDVFTIDAQARGNAARFINHSCTPNSGESS